MLNGIKLNEVYRHIKTGNLYKTKEFCEFKDTFCGEWLACVSYEPIDRKEKVYVRTLDNFAEKFEEVEDEN